MSYEIFSCKRCGHVWKARKEGGAKKCPRCQAPFEGFKESIPILEPSFESEDRQGIAQHLYNLSPLGDLSQLTEEEVHEIAEEQAERGRQIVWQKKADDDERRRQRVGELAYSSIIERGRSGLRKSLKPLSTEKKDLQNYFVKNNVERKREELLNELNSLKSFDCEKELENWLTKTESSRRILGRTHSPKEEEVIERLQEIEEIRKVAITIWEERLKIFDERIEELKKAEVEVAPLVKNANQIRNKALEPVKEEGQIIDKLCEADTFGRWKEVDKLLKSFRPLTAKCNQLERQHDQICVEINQHKIDPRPLGLLSFPSRTVLKLKLHDRVLKKLGG